MTTREDILNRIREAVGPKGCIEGAEAMEPYLVEERGLYQGSAELVVRPAGTEETAEVVRLCAEGNISITTQGGNTGLVGGGVPDGGIVLSTARMNRIREIDSLNRTLTAEAGCILADIQAAAEDADCLFPLSLGAEGSCRIGGNLSTNAGGVQVLRYGNARDLVLGLEAVLPDGRVWNGLRGLRKNNTGYDLKHLFIGAEGTLGIITAAVLKLFPRPRVRETAMVAADSVDAIMDLFARTMDACGDSLTAFEIIPRLGIEIVTAHIPGTRDPFTAPYPQYALIDLSSPRAGEPLREALETVLGKAFEDGIVRDAVFAESEGRRQDLWRLRETIPEAQKFEGGSIKHDIAVPISKILPFIAEASAIVERELPGSRVLAFGHVGDGNIHFNLLQPPKADKVEFTAHWGRLNRHIHDLAVEMGGSFSAEHGVGQLKRDDLARYKGGVELDLMRALKRALDPQNIMNPGKVVTPE